MFYILKRVWMAEQNPKWMYEISKKIATLTKTVFRLHAETVDRKEEVNELKQRYEDEIALAEAKSRSCIEEAQKQVQSYRENIDATVRMAYDTEFQKVRKEFDSIKNKLETQSKSIIDTAKAQLNDLKSQIDDLKSKADTQVSLFQTAQADLLNLSTDTIKKVEEKHKKELQQHVTDANKAYNEMVVITAKKEEELKKKYEAEIAELRKNLAEGQKSATESLLQKQKTLENQLKKQQCHEYLL